MFRDRAEAGRRLGEALQRCSDERPVLLGLARGGVPVAASAAQAMGAEFNALVVRKVKPQGEDREFGEGAVAPGGIKVTVGEAEPAPEELERAKREMERRVDAYLDGRPAPDIAGRLAILVDDGLATGVTALAAIRYARTLGPSKVVVAVPILSDEALAAVEAEAEGVVYLEKPSPFRAVKESYQTFDEVTDEEVRGLLHGEG